MNVSAKVDYAVRALVTLAAAGGTPVTGSEMAEEQELPIKFLEGILGELRRAGLVESKRGPVGGYQLGRPASQVSVADVIRAIDGPLAVVRGVRPESTSYDGAARRLQDVWIALRASIRNVLERTTIADIAADRLPAHVRRLVSDPDAWLPH